MTRWRNFHDGSGMLGKAVYHVSSFPLYRNSFLKCTDDLCFLFLLFTSIAKPVCGMIIPVKCHKQHSGKRIALVVVNNNMLTLTLSRIIKPWFKLYFALNFSVFWALVFFISLSVIINYSTYMKLMMFCVVWCLFYTPDDRLCYRECSYDANLECTSTTIY